MTSATIATELGDIEVDLYTQAAPKAAQNFIDLAKKGFYDDVIFHRVIPGFVAQAGDGEYGKKASARRRPRRDRRARLQVRRRADPRRLRARRARDGQRRPEHERQPVLHLRRRPLRPAPEELHDLRPGHEGHGRRRQDRQCPAKRARPAGFAGRDDLGDDRRGLSTTAGCAHHAGLAEFRALQCRCNDLDRRLSTER